MNGNWSVISCVSAITPFACLIIYNAKKKLREFLHAAAFSNQWVLEIEIDARLEETDIISYLGKHSKIWYEVVLGTYKKS